MDPGDAPLAAPAAVAGGLAWAVVGALLLGTGGSAWSISEARADELGLALVLAGLGVAGVVGAAVRADGVAALRRRAPRLYPFAGAAAGFAVAALAVVSVAAIVAAIFAEYAGALAGGDSAAVPDPARSAALYLVASGLLWAFAIWAVVLIAAVVRLGRASERLAGANPYGSTASAEPLDLPPAGPAAPPPPTSHRSSLVLAAVALALPTMAGIQTLEAGVDPPGVVAWFGLELITPVWAVGVGLSLARVDALVRGLERRYASALRRARPEGSPGPSAEGARRFVPW